MSSGLSRRDALRLAAVGAVAVAFPHAGFGADPSEKKVRMGFIGVGDRGTGLLRVTLARGDVVVPAVCDISEKAAVRAQDLVEKAGQARPEAYTKGGEDWRRMIARGDLDAVLIGTPQELHLVMSVESMKAGVYVGAEVPACVNIEECWQLVEAARKYDMRYMMLENYLYSQPVMQVQRMADMGVFGELTSASGSYIHEIRSMRFAQDGSLTWRGRNVLDTKGVVYPTHAIGPCARWMGVNKTDRLASLVAMDCDPKANRAYAAGKFGAESEQAKVSFQNGDNNLALVRTEKGRMIEIRYDTASPRPPGMGQYALQGTKGAYESALGQRKAYIEGRSKHDVWDDLSKYADEFQHPYWAERGDKAKATGHNGGDYFVISDFVESVRSGKSAVDVYDAVAWSCVRPLSEESIRAGSKPVAIPDFKTGRTA